MVLFFIFYLGMNPNTLFEEFPLNASEDALIVMHRDSHFGGSFDEMVAYYRGGGVGVVEEFSLRRVEELAAFEKLYGENIAPLLLSGADAERIAKARKIYLNLRAVYESRDAAMAIPRLIADLILSEEEDVSREVSALVALRDKALPALLELLASEDLYDTLFPGYGLAPGRALLCLQQLGDKKAIIALFEAIGRNDFFNDEQILSAFCAIGTPAKEFLLKILKGRPLTSDNEKAALALLAFKDDSAVAEACLAELLQPIDWKGQPLLATYLILGCVSLSHPSQRHAFSSLLDSSSLPSHVKNDLRAIKNSWK